MNSIREINDRKTNKEISITVFHFKKLIRFDGGEEKTKESQKIDDYEAT